MKKILIIGFAIGIILSSCKKEAKLNANLNTIDQNIITNKNEVDKWLDLNFLGPYNIETKYRFDRFELSLGKNITPPSLDRVIPAMEMIRDVWIKPYETVGGADFIKKISPKQFVLAGSAEYNSNGSITLGTAEGGRKVVIFDIDRFDKTKVDLVRRMIHLVQHEYTHILNQTVDFSPEYQTVSRGGYEANWTQRPLEEAYALGFISQYARVSPEEDFAEQSSSMLMMGRVKYNSIVTSLSSDAQVKLKKKEQYVVDYFKSAFNIDFYQLQYEVQKTLFKIAPPVLADMLGAHIGYTVLHANPSTDPKQSAEFIGLWNKSKELMQANGFILKDFKLIFLSPYIMVLRYGFTNADGTIPYFADADYDMSIDVNTGGTNFILNPTQPRSPFANPNTYFNMAYVNKMMAGVNAYFVSDSFKADWINKIIPGEIGYLGSYGAFYKTTDPNSYFYGKMGH